MIMMTFLMHRVNFSINLRNVLEVNITYSPLHQLHFLTHSLTSLTQLEVNEVAETVSVETTLRMFWYSICNIKLARLELQVEATLV